MIRCIGSLFLGLLFLTGSVVGQDKNAWKIPTGVDMVDQVRKAGWMSALSLIPKLETADEEMYPGIRQFAADVRRLEKSIEPKKPPHEWSAIAVDPLLHRNPNFWRAMYEMAPGDPAISIVHVGLLLASGEIDQAHSRDGKRLASGSGDGTIKVWDAMSGQELFTVKANTGLVYDVEFSANGERLATAGSDSSVRIRDAMSGQETHKWIHSAVKCMAFSPDGEWLASGGGPPKKPGEVKLWDAKTGHELLTLKGHTASVNRVVYSLDSLQLASASGEFGQPAEVKVWDAVSGQELLSWKGHTDVIKSMMFSPNGKLLATRSLDKSLKLWDATTGKELFTWKGYSFISMVFSSDSKRLMSASGNGLIRRWDVAP